MNVKVNVGTPVGGYQVEFFNDVYYWRVEEGYLHLYRSVKKGDVVEMPCLATIRDWSWIKEA